MSISRSTLFTTLIGALGAGPLLAQTTARVSVNTAGTQGNFQSLVPAVSADARTIAFSSYSFNLDPADLNGNADIFVRDRVAGTTVIASLTSGGASGDGDSDSPALSPDGRYLCLTSQATNLVPGDTNFARDIFLRDLSTGALERVSVSSAGAQSDLESYHPASITPDGRFVAFDSRGTTLVAGDTNGRWDVFVRDRLLGTTERVSTASGGAQGNNESVWGQISADGRYVVFVSYASNLVAGDTNLESDVFVHDRQTGVTERVALAGALQESDGEVWHVEATPDLRFLAFESDATNLVFGDTNGWSDMFVHDRATGLTERISVSSLGVQANGGSSFPALSADGRHVAFLSVATDLVVGDTNGFQDLFVRDRAQGTTTRANVSSAGVQANGEAAYPALSADGRWLAFESLATNLVTGDTNNARDIFLRDRGALPPGTDLCQPGAAGVSACPCANGPANAPRGCDNSAATGGAQLASSGTSAIGADTLVFISSGELPSATSILLQGDLELPAGIAFGQGVRCAGGRLLRLFVKTAVGGSISAPQAGDLSVAARSTSLGDVLGPVSVRWYAVYYRDGTVLGGCPATSNFNSTQTQRVVWTP